MVRSSRIHRPSSRSPARDFLRAAWAGAALAAAAAVAAPVLAEGPSRPVQRLIEVAQDLFPEVETERVSAAPKPGEPAAVLTARLRPEVAVRRVRQASERARTFSGGAVAGAAVDGSPGIRLSVMGASGREIGTLLVVGAGREVRIEVRAAGDEAAPPPVESLPAVPVPPDPVMRTFPLQD